MSWIKRVLRSEGPEGEDLNRLIDDELRFHLEMRTADSLSLGMTPEDARADAVRRFGDFKGVRNRCREISLGWSASSISLRVFNVFIGVMLASGLMLRLLSAEMHVQRIGTVLVMIAVLWRI